MIVYIIMFALFKVCLFECPRDYGLLSRQMAPSLVDTSRPMACRLTRRSRFRVERSDLPILLASILAEVSQLKVSLWAHAVLISRYDKIG